MGPHELLELATSPDRVSHRDRLGERRLLTAVLHQALDDLSEYGSRSDPNARRIHEAASGWIFGKQLDADDHLSFDRTCELVGLDPTYVRRLVREQTGTNATSRPRRRAA